MAEERIVAIGLLTQREVELLGHGFARIWPLDETPCFDELLEAIDEAERQLRGEMSAEPADPTRNPLPHPGPGEGIR